MKGIYLILLGILAIAYVGYLVYYKQRRDLEKRIKQKQNKLSGKSVFENSKMSFNRITQGISLCMITVLCVAFIDTTSMKDKNPETFSGNGDGAKSFCAVDDIKKDDCNTNINKTDLESETKYSKIVFTQANKSLIITDSTDLLTFENSINEATPNINCDNVDYGNLITLAKDQTYAEYDLTGKCIINSNGDHFELSNKNFELIQKIINK